MEAVGVFFAGPEPYRGSGPDYDEVPRWTILVGNEDGYPIEGEDVMVFSDYYSAESVAHDIAERLGLELVDEARAYA